MEAPHSSSASDIQLPTLQAPLFFYVGEVYWGSSSYPHYQGFSRAVVISTRLCLGSSFNHPLYSFFLFFSAISVFGFVSCPLTCINLRARTFRIRWFPVSIFLFLLLFFFNEINFLWGQAFQVLLILPLPYQLSEYIDPSSLHGTNPLQNGLSSNNTSYRACSW